MAIYKPNNFYPYMQEVDLESDEGVVFSCQANTDGNSMIRAARLRILDKDNNIVLYEKIQNLDNTVSNGEIVKFKVKPYYFDIMQENTSINFVTLTPNEKIENRLSYCPYNIYQEQIYDLHCFNIKYIIDSEINKIDNYKITIDGNTNYLFNTNYSQNGKIGISLKNDKDYIWDIELFEDLIETDNYVGTFNNVGKITGTTKNVVWIDKNNQHIQVYNNIDKINEEKYIEYNLNEFNSDIYYNKLNEGYTLSGKLELNVIDEDTSNFKDWKNGNFYSDRGKLETSDRLNWSLESYQLHTNPSYYVRTYGIPILYTYDDSDSDTYVYYFSLGSSKKGELIFGDIYQKLDEGDKIFNEDLNIVKFNNEYSIFNNTSFSSYIQSYLYSNQEDLNVFSIAYHRPIRSNDVISWKDVYNVESWNELFIKQQWREVFNISVAVDTENEKLILVINEDTEVGQTLDDCCFKVQKGYGSYWNENDVIHPISTKSAKTTVVANSQLLDSTISGVIEKSCVNDEFDKNIYYAMPNEEIYKINGIIYRTRVLTPLAYSPTWCIAGNVKVGNYKYMSCALYNRLISEQNPGFSDILSCQVDANGEYILDENGIPIINNDYYCYVNNVPNAVETMIFKNLVNPDMIDVKQSEEDVMKSDLTLKNKNIQLFDVTPNNIYNLTIHSDIMLNNNNIQINIVETNGINILEENILLKMTNIGDTYTQSISIPYYFDKPQLQISFIDNIKNFKNVKLNVDTIGDEISIKLLNSTVPDLDLENLFLNIGTSEFNGENYCQSEDIESYLIKKIINNNIILEKDQIQKQLIDRLSSENIYYYLSYIDRKKISWITDDLGNNSNIFKIELEEEIPYNLKNSSTIDIYETDDNYTRNSFFGVKDIDLNVDNLYVRFPGYVGEDINGNSINDIIPYYDYAESLTAFNYTTYPSPITNTLSASSIPVYFDENGYAIWGYENQGLRGYFFNNNTDMYYFRYSYNGSTRYISIQPQSCNNIYHHSDLGFQPIQIYGTNVRNTAFEEQTITVQNPLIGETGEYNVYCKLFKVTNYNPDTGEIIFAGGLSRKLENTDRYELWQANIIEGSSNDYDITEVIKTYTRVYPEAIEKDAVAYVGGNRVVDSSVSVLSNSKNFFFIQPNINIIFSEYNTPYLKSLKDDSRNYFQYKNNKQFFTITNKTVDILDDSQWMVKNVNNYDFFIGDDYEIYQNSMLSTSSYFYGRNTEDLILYTIPRKKINKMELIEGIIDEKFLFSKNQVDDYYIINNLDFYIYGHYNHTEPLKKYIIKIYDSNMKLIYNSKEVYNSYILYHVKGLNNNQMYYMTIECENQIGNIIMYEQKFVIQYIEGIINNISLKVENDCDKSRTIITFINPNNENCLIDDFINAGILEDSIIDIYRRDYNGNIEWIFNIDLQNDKSFYGYENNDYKYAFYDYNVRNDEKYEYFAVLDIEEHENNYTYFLSSGEIKTSFNSWTIVDIIEDENGCYSVTGDEWSFRYNLESDDLAQNTSVTTWDTLGRYGQVGKGEKNFISSGMRCLLGDVGVYNIYDSNLKKIQRFGYNEKDNSINNITKYEKWKKFCNSFSKKLLKDLKGNKWIVQIVENPNVSNDDNSYEQIYTISFTWHEIDDANLISICNRVENIAADNNFKEKSERYMNYGDENIVPSDKSLFNFVTDDETMTASVSLANNEKIETVVYGFSRTIINSSLQNIVIPYKYERNGKEYLVTSIEDEGFANCSEIKSIRIPNSIYMIGEAAFSYCNNLNDIIVTSNNDNYMVCEDGVLFNKNKTELIQYPIAKSNKNYTIPETVNKVHTKAFANASNLQLIITPKKMNEIGAYAFADCNNIKNIIIPDGVVTINEKTFENCISLDSIVIPNSVIDIKENTFNSCDILSKIYYVGTEESYNKIIGCNVLSGDKIYADGYQILNLDNSTINIENIGDNLKVTMVNVDSNILGDIIIPMYVTDIIKDTFYNCNQVEKIILPNKLNNMEDDVFADCSKLISIFIDDNNVNYSSEHGVLFNKNKTQLIRYPQNNQIVDYYIPDTVKEISECAFHKCCHLTNLQISENNENYTTDNYGVLYNKNKTELIQYPSANERTLYSTSINTEIIKSYAFYKASNINKFIFERNITNIEANVFIDYYPYVSVYYYGTEDDFNKIKIDKNSNDLANLNKRYIIDNCRSGFFEDNQDEDSLIWEMYEMTLKISGNNNMPDFTLTENAPWKYHSVEDLIDNIIFDIPDRTSFYIGAYTFYDLVNLKNIELPTIPLVIGNHAFENCKSLENINFSELVNDIGEYAFAGCSKLKQIDLSKGLSSKRISNNLFMSCYSLTGVNLPNDIISIGDNAFLQCQNLEYLEIPETVIYIGSQAFSNCKITNITIPKNVNNIEKRAFMECFSLMEINVDSNNNIYSSMDGVLFSKDKSTLICYPIGKSQVYGEDGSLCGIYDIPNTVTRIEDYAFEFSKLIQVNIPEIIINESVGTNLTQIGKESFVHSNIQTINLVPGIFYVEDMAFAFCYNLTTINETNEVPDSVNYLGNDVFYWCENLIYTVPESVATLEKDTYYYDDTITEIFIPNSIKKIEGYAFYTCPNLTTIHIPSSVEEIAFDMVWSCDNFVNFDVDAGNSYYSSRDGLLCNQDGSVLISVPFGITDLTIPYCVTTITGTSFSSLMGLNSLYIHDNVEFIEYGSLYSIYSGLKSLRLPFIGQSRDNIGSLNQMIFGGDTVEASIEYNLEELIISDTVEEISFNALSRKINRDTSNVISEVSNGCSKLKKLTVPFAGGSESTNKNLGYIFGSAKVGENGYCIPETLTELTITNTQTMNRSCLYGFNNLEKLTIPFVGTGYYNSNNADYIFGLIFGASGFRDQGVIVPTSLREVIITNQNNRISNNAFQNCSNIEKIVIFSGINIINSTSFQVCHSLREIYIPKTVTFIGESAFYDCMNLTDIYYEGTEEEWNNIQIQSQSATSFYNATKHYNSNYENEY